MTEETADDLIRALLDAPDGASALQAIAKLGQARVGLSHLWDQTGHRYARFRAAAFEAMAKFSDEDTEGSEPVILRGLEDENAFVSTAAARAAAALGIYGAVPSLREQTTHQNRYVRSSACLALGALGTSADFFLLAEVLRTDDDDRVIERAARALGRLGTRLAPPAAIQEATIELFDEVMKLRTPARWQATRGLLGIFKNMELDESLQGLLLSLLAEEGVRGAAARVLGAHGVEAARPIIESHLPAEPSPRLRNELVLALADLGAEPSLEVLLSLTDGPLDTVSSQNLIRVLVEVQDSSAVAAVLRLATGPDVALRATARRVIPPDHPLRIDLALSV